MPPRTVKSKALQSALCFALFFYGSRLALSAEVKPLHVFAAASLAAVMQPISQAYQDATGQEVKLSFGASSTLARQISFGAPAHVFISANPLWMQSLIDSGVVETGKSQDLLHNSLVLVAPAGSTINSNKTLPTASELTHWLQEKRLAVGDPQHVPIGLYAEQALSAAGLWRSVENRLAPTEDARASLALLQRGEVALGIVYHSDLKAIPDLHLVAELPMPDGMKISYPVAVIGEKSHKSGTRFVNFLQSSAATHFFIEMGFSPAS